MRRPKIDIPPPEIRLTQEEETPRTCDFPGCTEHGLYKAPKSRGDLRSYYWFCLEHVKQYNAAWDYYANMSEAEIERSRREDVWWDRPTWPLGKAQPIFAEAMRTTAYAFRDSNTAEEDLQEDPLPILHKELKEAFKVLEIDKRPKSFADIKQQYKTLVKQWHPDRHKDKEVAEEKLKDINHAFSVAKRYAMLFPDVASS